MEDLKIGYYYGYYVSKRPSSEEAVYLGTDLEFHRSMCLKPTPYMKTRREAEQLLQRYKDSFNMISLDKQYKTRDGREVRVFMVDGGGEWPILGAYKDQDAWYCNEWTSKGTHNYAGTTNGYDLIEVVPEKEVWLVHNTKSGSVATYHAEPSAKLIPIESFVHKVTLNEENKL